MVTVIPSVALASFIQADTTTQGNWVGAYGIDGYSLANVAVATIPSYAVLAVQNASSYTWAQTSFDPRALQMPGGSQRMAATWYNAPSFTFDVNLTDGHPHQVAIYALDWDSKGRVENVQVLDANSGFLLSSQTISNFTGGVYLAWTITGHVQTCRKHVRWAQLGHKRNLFRRRNFTLSDLEHHQDPSGCFRSRPAKCSVHADSIEYGECGSHERNRGGDRDSSSRIDAGIHGGSRMDLPFQRE